MVRVVKIKKSFMQIERRSMKLVKRRMNNHIVGLVHKHHMIVNETWNKHAKRRCLMYDEA